MSNPNASACRGIPHFLPALTRRDMLVHGGGGFGALALAYLLGESPIAGRAGKRATQFSASPSAWRRAATARSCIFLFMEGPSHLDTFDPKPKLNELAGQ